MGGINIKKKLITLVAVIVVIVIAFFAFNSLYLQNYAIVGDSFFNIPDGFHQVSENNTIKLESDNTTIFLVEYPNNNITDCIDLYKKVKKGENQTISITTFNVNDTKVYKSNLEDNPETIHYWFLKDNKVYEFYTWNGDEKTDDVIKNMIKS